VSRHLGTVMTQNLPRGENEVFATVHKKVANIPIFLNGGFRVSTPIFKIGVLSVDSLQFSKLKPFL